MKTKYFALFLIAVGLCWLLPVAPPAYAATAPLIVQQCGQDAQNAHSPPASMTCVLSGVTSGNTLLLDATGVWGTSLSVTSATESFTCPAGAAINDGTGLRGAMECYVALSSSHSSFTVTVTASGSPPVGGTAQVDVLEVQEVKGLGAIDSGATGKALGASPSLSTTTANANEWVHLGCGGYTKTISPGSGFTQDLWVSSHVTSSQEYTGLTAHQIVSSASTVTSTCTFTNGLSPLTAIVLAFQQSSPPAVPSVKVIQACVFEFNSNAGGETCELHNTTSGNKVVLGASGLANTSPITGMAGSCTESCTCPSNTFAAATYNHAYQSTICYVDTASSHALFTASIVAGGPATYNTYFITAMEVSGLQSGIDAGSEAGCAAVTCSYTTASANEWAFFFGSGQPNGTQMLPGNSFAQSLFGNSTGDNGASESSQFIDSILSSTGASGSKTASYSQTSNAAPLLSVAAFNPTVPPFSGYPMVIKYRVRPYRIPWDRPRRQMLLETI